MHGLLMHFAQNLTVNLPVVDAKPSEIKQVINLLLSIAGAVALLVITMAGFRFVTSRGDTQQVAQARNAIIYSSIGLVVLVSAFVIVNFVVFKLR
ncbi:MAG TPA: pilin [Candidatus Saccharimonadales bacterium]|nr:pilin [Candidatus Saccharimonadales bacterium]